MTRRLNAKPAQIIPAWDNGLKGVPVGSRVMLIVPPAQGYGKTGNTQAGIKGTDDLVFIVDPYLWLVLGGADDSLMLIEPLLGITPGRETVR
jgi:hypothetical protein